MIARHRLKDPEPVVTPKPVVQRDKGPWSGSPPAWVHDMIALLCQTYPKTFFLYERKRRPLKIGIREDLIRAMGNAIDPAQAREALGWALRIYCANSFYLDAIRVGHARIDLDGNAVGCVNADQAKAAMTFLKARAKNGNAKRLKKSMVSSATRRAC